MKEAKSLLEIVKCFLLEKDCTLDYDIEEKKLYQLAKVNQLSNFLENWAQKNSKSETIRNQIAQDYSAQIVKDTNQTIEIEKILNAFEENHIKTLIVKGSVIKDIYPQNYMRQMCDIDILVEPDNFKKAAKIMKDMGYQKYYNYEKHLIFTKDPFIIVELHRKLILKKEIIGFDYFKDVWPLCVKYKNYENIYQLDVNNAYVFCIHHLLIHFKITGITAKDVLDVYLYNEFYKDVLNYDTLNKIFADLGILEFSKNIKNIAYKWFGTDKIDDLDEIETFILKGRNLNNRVNYSIEENNGKLNYFVQLLFPKMEIMQEKFPVLNKFPLLLPAMWITRIVKDVTSKGTSLKTRFDTIKLIKEADKQEIQNIKDIYQKFGIK